MVDSTAAWKAASSGIARPDRLPGVVENPRERLKDARLYLICETIEEQRLEAALEGGVDMVELLEGDRSDEQLLATAARVRPLCERHGALLMLNNRPELVAQAGADGVHIDRAGIDLAQARAAIGPEKLLGTSTHS